MLPSHVTCAVSDSTYTNPSNLVGVILYGLQHDDSVGRNDSTNLQTQPIPPRTDAWQYDASLHNNRAYSNQTDLEQSKSQNYVASQRHGHIDQWPATTTVKPR